MDKRTREFEKFMIEAYGDEADWHEGWNRVEMYEAFIAGIEYIMNKERNDA